MFLWKLGFSNAMAELQYAGMDGVGLGLILHHKSLGK